MEEIDDPGWGDEGSPRAVRPPRRLPGVSFLAWLCALGTLTALGCLRVLADRARDAGLPVLGGALDVLAIAVAVAAAAAALRFAARRMW
jgi:hypothetical protein